MKTLKTNHMKTHPHDCEYTAPEIDVLDLKNAGVLCDSGYFEVTNPFDNGEGDVTEDKW